MSSFLTREAFWAKQNLVSQKQTNFGEKFIFESVQDLQLSLHERGANLNIFFGKTEEIIADLASKYRTSWVFCNRERTHEELQIQDALEQKLWSLGQEIIYSRGKLLYHTQDLPFPIAHTPENFTAFRKEVEKTVPVREPLEAASQLKYYAISGEHPSITLEDLGYQNFEGDERSALHFQGGERNALARLQYYLWGSDHIKRYKETRNELLGSDYSSKLSPWLAQGCISPKLVYHELKRYESERGANDSTYWLFFELLWRDYFRLIGKKVPKPNFRYIWYSEQPKQDGSFG